MHLEYELYHPHLSAVNATGFHLAGWTVNRTRKSTLLYDFKQEIEREAEYQMRRLYNYPSVIL